MTLYDHNLTPWLQLSGQYIVQERPANERAQWVLELLNEIQQFLSPEEFAALLREVGTEIGQRIAAMDGSSG